MIKRLFSLHQERKRKKISELNNLFSVYISFTLLFNWILLIPFIGWLIYNISYVFLGDNSIVLTMIFSTFLGLISLVADKDIFILYLLLFKRKKMVSLSEKINDYKKYKNESIVDLIINSINNLEYNELILNKEFIIKKSKKFNIVSRKRILSNLENSLDFHENQEKRIMSKGIITKNIDKIKIIQI
jgi:hypothetical protein